LDEEEELPKLVSIFWKLSAYDIQVPISRQELRGRGSWEKESQTQEKTY
jgi:hypothetical protein